MYTCVCFYLPDHRRSALSFFTMGSSCSNHLGIPPGNGPNAVGCTDFMMDHTAEVQAKENLCSRWHVTAEVTYLCLTFLSVLQMLGWVPTGIGPNRLLTSREQMAFCWVAWTNCLSLQQGTFFRLYYPCQEMESAGKPDWVPYKEYFNGLADFMKMNRALSERIFNYLFGE